MRIIKNIPFHCILLGPLFILFLYVHNFNEVHFENTLRGLAVSLLFSVILFLIFFTIFRWNIHKAGFMLSITILVLFSYGMIYNILENMFYAGLWPLAHIHRHLTGAYFITLIVIFLFILRTTRSLKSLTFPMNIFLGILYMINFMLLASKLTPAMIAGNYQVKPENSRGFHAKTQENTFLPDIYYIILDGYANDSVLKKFYGYAGNPFTQYLRHNGFILLKNSRTNYPSTSESLGSTLNLDYHPHSDSEYLVQSISNNKVCQYLKSKGYHIPHIRTGYSVTRYNHLADTVVFLDNVSEFERGLLRYTIFRLDDLTGYLHYLQLRNQMKKIFLLPDMPSPKFVFIHIVSPHPPFVCGPDGKYKPRSDLSHKWWEPKSDYLDQLEYINTNIQRFVDTLLRKPGQKPIIIIQSDHGPWMQDPNKDNIYLARSMILNSCYIPYGWADQLYDTITPVNTFRIVFNGIFRDSLSLLPDRPFTYQGIENSPVFNMMND